MSLGPSWKTKTRILAIIALVIGLAMLLGAIVLLITIAVGAASFLLVMAYFTRDPDREIRSDADSILSPADGTIMFVKQLEWRDICKEPGIVDLDASVVKTNLRGISKFYSISIFMSVLDVHVNRAPISGTVVCTVHRRGEFLPLGVHEKKNQARSERNTILIRGNTMSVAVVQIASHLVRKIESWVSQGAFIEQGSRIGWIRMGSEVDIVFPAHEHPAILVREGERVKAGLTPLAAFDGRLLDEVQAQERPSADRSDTSMKGRLWNGYVTRVLYLYLWSRLAMSALRERVAVAAGREHR